MTNSQEIYLDISDNKSYQYIYEKQYNQGTKLIFHITKNGELFNFENASAVFKLKKPDKTIVIDNCIINDDLISVTLTPQMTSTYGDAWFEVTLIENDTIIGTVSAKMKIDPSTIQDEDVESSDEFSFITKTLILMQDIRLEMNQLSNQTEENSILASEKAEEANRYAQSAKISEENAKISEENAKESEENSKTYEENSKNSENLANESALSASSSESNANIYATQAQSFLSGGTGTRENEDVDNSRFYYQQIKSISEELSGVLHPMGTIDFDDLNLVDKVPGYMYNIRNSFVTTDEFKEGSGFNFPSGTNIYFTTDGYWDCLAGTWGNIVELISDTEPLQNIGEYWIQEYD